MTPQFKKSKYGRFKYDFDMPFISRTATAENCNSSLILDDNFTTSSRSPDIKTMVAPISIAKSSLEKMALFIIDMRKARYMPMPPINGVEVMLIFLASGLSRMLNLPPKIDIDPVRKAKPLLV